MTVSRRTPSVTYLLLLLAGLVAFGAAIVAPVWVSLVAGLIVLGLSLLGLALLKRPAGPGTEPSAGNGDGDGGPLDHSRRRFLGWAAVVGLFFVAGGTSLGRVVRRVVRPDPATIVEGMADDIGSEYMELVRRGFHAPTSGDLQLLLAPGNSSNYSQESVSLIHNDPRTSHASVWMYLERVPLAVYAPGIVEPGFSEERVTLADITPTTAALIGADLPPHDGRPLPGVTAPGKPPKVVVTFVIDGGGWNVLQHWHDAWPNMKRLMGKSLLFTNALHGSFPAVTAVAHATIGTGAFAQHHGISGHNLRINGVVRKAYGVPGDANPDDIKLPTLADIWTEQTGAKAFIGQFGYQVWHMGMIGNGGTAPLGRKPVGIYWDEPNYRWAPHNPELFRLPDDLPDDTTWKREFAVWKAAHPDDFPPIQPAFTDEQSPACSPPIIKYQGDVVAAAFDSEDIGNHDATDLVYINYKSPDYTGHIYNMLEPQEEPVLRAVDEELQRVVDLLEERFSPGEFALIFTADHGQCPLPNDVDGVRLDPIQLQIDIDAEFATLDAQDKPVTSVVNYTAPSEVFLDGAALTAAGHDPAQIAAWLKDYTYGENYHLYKGVPRDAIDWNRLNYNLFSGIMPAAYLSALQDHPSEVATFGATKFPEADPGIPTAPSTA
jgi:hypothetical protein